MEKRLLTFRPTDEEIDFLDENNINWSSLCHETLRNKINGYKQEITDQISNKLLIILLGIMCIIFTFAISNLLVLVVTSICGVIIVFIGVFSLIRMYRNAR